MDSEVMNDLCLIKVNSRMTSGDRTSILPRREECYSNNILDVSSHVNPSPTNPALISGFL